jgi:alginate O-acetyltransferase complex protein AlgI
MPLFFTGNLPHSLDIYAAMIGLNGLGSLDMYHFGTSAMTISFVFVALAWVAIAGRINIRYYAGNKEQYFMQNVSGAYALLLWAGFLLTISRLAANSFSPFLYFQF